ncbi:MAG: hypothetical protein N2039_12850 [Gemmataceae bacterium]|nr:hypothetical protein [Gemmataceae bacterium]
MPIRFRCGHCQQLLGIARRKAGTVVTCPSCQQAVIVPTMDEAEAFAGMTQGPSVREGDRSKAASSAPPPPPPPPDAPPGGFVFERSDFDELFRPVIELPKASKTSRRRKEPEPIAEALPVSGPAQALALDALSTFSDEPAGQRVASSPARLASGGIVLTPPKMVLLAALAIGGMIFAFGGGLLVGMYLLPR